MRLVPALRPTHPRSQYEESATPGIPIPAPVVKELQRQFNHELGAAHAYTALATWCVDRNLKGFARFFHKQSGEGREHAQRFMDHLHDGGVMPELGALPAPKSRFKTLLEVAKHALAMEQANTAGIHRAHEAALKAKDYPAQVALQWFIAEQVEEEAWCDEMVACVQSAEAAGGVGYLDRHIERSLSEPTHGGGQEDRPDPGTGGAGAPGRPDHR